MDPWSGAIFAVIAYAVFSLGMSTGLIPVPSRRAQRIGASILVAIFGAILVGQVALLLWVAAAR